MKQLGVHAVVRGSFPLIFQDLIAPDLIVANLVASGLASNT
jgi:hypothetical protein